MHPHGAERHTLVVAQTGAQARIERAAQPEVAPQPERELHVVHHAAAGCETRAGAEEKNGDDAEDARKGAMAA